MHDIFKVFGHFLCRVISSALLWKKYSNYPLTTTQGDRFASCENIVSRSQNSSLPPPPLNNPF